MRLGKAETLWQHQARRASGLQQFLWELRVAASLGAAAVVVLICVHQHHWQLIFSAWGWRAMVYHRCGRLFVWTVTWAALECVGLAAWALCGDWWTSAAPENLLSPQS